MLRRKGREDPESVNLGQTQGNELDVGSKDSLTSTSPSSLWRRMIGSPTLLVTRLELRAEVG